MAFPRRALAAVALLLATPAALPAQARDRGDPWLGSWIVYPTYNSLERFGATGVITRRKAPRPGPEPITASLDLQGRLTTSGTRSILLRFDAPGYWRDWRLLALAGAERATRTPYYGLGHVPISDSAEAANGSLPYYRYELLRTTLAGAVQRRVTGPVRALAGVQWRHIRARPLAGGATKLSDDLAAGIVNDTGSTENFEARIGMVYDTRDEEESPARGVFLEAVVAKGLETLGGDLNYTRWMLGARGFLPVGEFTTLAGRILREGSNRSTPFAVMYERLTSWRPEEAFGGTTTLRANLPGRWLAPNRAIASVDLRYKKIDVPFPRAPIRVWVLAFADAGLLWLDNTSPNFSDLQAGGGVGARFQYSKSGMFGIDFTYGRDAGLGFATAFQFAY